MLSKMQKILLGVSACLLPVAASCKARPFTVTVPSGYTGEVAITCDATGSSEFSVATDAHGLAEAKVCPERPTDVVVIRDGKRVDPAAAPNWELTGDRIPVGIRFSVK
jgi:hypothetical protein